MLQIYGLKERVFEVGAWPRVTPHVEAETAMVHHSEAQDCVTTRATVSPVVFYVITYIHTYTLADIHTHTSSQTQRNKRHTVGCKR